MHSGSKLLGRIALDARRPADDRADDTTAIVEHLTLLLNTRAEGCLLDASFGLPDLTEFVHAGPAGVAALQHLLAARVTRHEPRLGQLTVHARDVDPALPGLRFALRATRPDGSRLSLTACVAHGGQVTVTHDPDRP